jgi:hypothetical protein
LEALLLGIEEKWAAMDFVVKAHKGQKDAAILDGFDEILGLLDDTNVNILTAMSSRCWHMPSVCCNARQVVELPDHGALGCFANACHISYQYSMDRWRGWHEQLIETVRKRALLLLCRCVSGVQKEVDTLSCSLRLLSDTLDEYMELQRTWMHLEPIFGAQDIQRQLPEESRQFTSIERQFKSIVCAVVDRPNVMHCFTSPGLLTSLKSSNEALEHIQVRLWHLC